MSSHLLKRADIDATEEIETQHQFNYNAIRHSRPLARQAGMQRLGIHLVRIKPGFDSTTHHYHDADEEFIYIVSGRGRARIGEEEFDIEAGDFMGFPAPSPAHSMHNPYADDLVYLMGAGLRPHAGEVRPRGRPWLPCPCWRSPVRSGS